MEGVLPNPKIRDRIAKLAVGLAADCDAAESGVEKLMADNLPGAGALPFTAFVTPDLRWVAGHSGYLDVAGFSALLEKAEKSPAMDASADAARRLDALAKDAEANVEKAQWTKVLDAGRAAGEVLGRSPARAKIRDAVAKARAFAEGELAKALAALQGGGDRAAQRAALKKLSAAFAGEPEAKEADAGVKAVERLGVLDAVGADRIDVARDKATKDFAGTRWVALFAKPAPKPAEPKK